MDISFIILFRAVTWDICIFNRFFRSTQGIRDFQGSQIRIWEWFVCLRIFSGQYWSHPFNHLSLFAFLLDIELYFWVLNFLSRYSFLLRQNNFSLRFSFSCKSYVLFVFLFLCSLKFLHLFYFLLSFFPIFRSLSDLIWNSLVIAFLSSCFRFFNLVFVFSFVCILNVILFD